MPKNAFPNIVYIHSHDTGRYIQPYGYQVETPRLQQLAEEGVLFRKAFTVNPTCSPSRSALLTGTYPHENGMFGLAHRGFRLNNYKEHIVETLKTCGYHCALSGIQHIATSDDTQEAWQKIGYHERLEGNEDVSINAAEFLSRTHESPFFLSVGFFETHREFPETDPEILKAARYVQPASPFADTPETRLDRARYNASAKILDEKIGRVLDAIDANGLRENTFVICTTDHGIAFPRMKCNLEDSGTGVMLMLRGPKGFKGGKVIDAMVSHLDLFPTICDISNINQPDRLRGKSLLPLVNESADSLHDTLFFEVNYHAAYEPIRGVRTDRFKYIKRFEHRENPTLPNIDAGESKTHWLNEGYADQKPDQEMLFDLVFDPNETRNLIDSEAHQNVLEDMRNRLNDWMRETEDPLLSGDIPLPGPVQVNTLDQIDPGPDCTTLYPS